MSIQFNDTTTYKGLVQFYEKECGFRRGYISGNTDFLKEFAADANIALDEFFNIGFKASGTWQLDDNNHTAKHPIIKTNIVSGQRDYSFTADQSSNLILDIYRVFVKKSATGNYEEIFPVDAQSDKDTTNFTNGADTGGAPTKYDKTGNTIFFDLVPNYNATYGLKIYINREASYFTYDAPTKKPGVPGILHDWFYIKPACDYGRRNLSPEKYTRLLEEKTRLERKIEDLFRRRQKDVRARLSAGNDSNK